MDHGTVHSRACFVVPCDELGNRFLTSQHSIISPFHLGHSPSSLICMLIIYLYTDDSNSDLAHSLQPAIT